MPSDTSTISRGGNHGSEKRQRTKLLAIRVTPEEYALVNDQAARAGLATGSYVRDLVLGAPAPRQVRRPPVERKELARLLGALGHVGGNLNQLAHHANAGMPEERSAVASAFDDLRAMRDAVLAALGREP